MALEESSTANGLLSASAYRRGVNLWFGYLGLITLVYGLLTAKVYRSWTVADWLINYEGGFVRRGLAGQVAFELGHFFHASPVVFVTLCYLSLYALLLLAGRALALQARPNAWMLAVLLSPATFSFPVLDATGGFRKEVLFLAVLALLLAVPKHLRPKGTSLSLALAVVLCAGVLAHEALICYAPYLFAALLVTRGMVTGQTVKKASLLFALPLLAGIATAFVCLRHPGDLSTASRICSSLGYTLGPQGKQVCSGGAIGYLGFTPAMARARTWTYVRDDLYFIVYPLATALALWPLVLGSLHLARAGRGREVKAIWFAAAAAFAGTVPLFVYAEDWGRWIYIHILSLALLLLYLNGRYAAAGDPSTTFLPLPRSQKRRAVWALVAYTALWSLPHVPSRTLPFGYLGLLHYISLYL